MGSLPILAAKKRELLGTFPIFRNAPADLVDAILSGAIPKPFERGDSLYTEGDSCPFIGFLISGELRVFKVGEGGREITLYEVFPGETCILNASCILSHLRYPANAAAITNGDMLLVSAELFRKLIAQYEEMRRFVFRLFTYRFSAIIELVEEVAFGSMDGRLMDYLLEKAENDVIQATHQEIADNLGTSREVVSRLLKDFERRGRVFLSRNRIRINS